MHLRAHIQFDESELETFDRALRGHANALEDEPRHKKEETYLPVRTFLNRIVEHGDPLDIAALDELETVLLRLVVLWTPQTQFAYWKRIAPESGDEALAGLARERQLALGRVQDAIVVTRRALDLARTHELLSPMQPVPA